MEGEKFPDGTHTTGTDVTCWLRFCSRSNIHGAAAAAAERMSCHAMSCQIKVLKNKTKKKEREARAPCGTT